MKEEGGNQTQLIQFIKRKRLLIISKTKLSYSHVLVSIEVPHQLRKGQVHLTERLSTQMYTPFIDYKTPELLPDFHLLIL